MNATTTPTTRELQRAVKQVNELAQQLQRAPANEGVVASLERLADVRKQVRSELSRRGALAPALTASSAVQADVPVPTTVNARKALDLPAVGAYTAEALDKLRRQGNIDGTARMPVVRTTATWPTERLLPEDFQGAADKITAAQRAARRDEPVEALTAALCAPLEARYDIPEIGSLERPIRDGLLRFSMERGGVQYRRALGVDFADAGLGIWREADDDAEPFVAKTCLELTCPPVEEARLQAVYLCLTLANMTGRFDREYAEQAVRAALVGQTRLAENELLRSILDGSTLVTTAGDLGAARDVLEALDRSAAYLRSRHRLDPAEPLRWIAPAWVLNMLRADLVRQHASGSVDAFAVADAELLDWFNLRRIRPSWHADGLAEQTVGATTVPAQTFADAAAEGALPAYPAQIDTALFQEADWLHLDGGTMDLGAVRDSSLNTQNRYQVFSETFETATFTGVESLRLLIDTSVTGLSAGTNPA